MADYDHQVIIATDLGNTGRLKPDFSEMLENPFPDENAFTLLTQKVAGEETATQMTHTVQYEWPPDRELAVTSASAAAADISVDDRSGVVAGMVFEVLSGTTGARLMQVRVQSTPSSGAGSIDVTPSSGSRVYDDSSTDVSIPKDSKLRLLANYRSENDAVSTAVMRAAGDEVQYIGIMERKIAWTRVAEKVSYYGIKEHLRIERQQLREFARDREHNLKLAVAKADTGTATTATAGGPLYIPDGIMAHARRWNRVNVSTTGGTLSLKTFQRACQQTNRRGGKGEKFVFLSENLYSDLAYLPLKLDIARQDAAKDKLQIELKVVKFANIPNVTFVVDEDFRDREEMLIADFRGVKLKRLEGITFLRDVQTPGTRRTEHVVFCHEGLKVEAPWRQGVIEGVKRICA